MDGVKEGVSAYGPIGGAGGDDDEEVTYTSIDHLRAAETSRPALPARSGGGGAAGAAGGGSQKGQRYDLTADLGDMSVLNGGRSGGGGAGVAVQEDAAYENLGELRKTPKQAMIGTADGPEQYENAPARVMFKAAWNSPDGTLEKPVLVPVVIYMKCPDNKPTLFVDHAKTKRNIHTFPIELLRGYGQRDGRLKLEAGRRCPGGPGQHRYTVGKNDVASAMKTFVADWKSNGGEGKKR